MRGLASSIRCSHSRRVRKAWWREARGLHERRSTHVSLASGPPSGASSAAAAPWACGWSRRMARALSVAGCFVSGSGVHLKRGGVGRGVEGEVDFLMRACWQGRDQLRASV